MKKIGIGYEKYKDYIDQKLYYIDKTLLVRDIIEQGGKVTLFTRPRRFGKTLALSMLRTFFENEMDREGNSIDNFRYFEGMKVMERGEDITSRLGKYPVINLSLKSAKQPDFRAAFLKLREVEKSISTFDSSEAFYHGYLLSLLTGMPSYVSRSNREEGDGRPYIVLYPNRPKEPAYIFDIKIREKFSEMGDGIEEAFEQIRDRKYEEGVLDDGYTGVVSYGVCF